MRISDLDYIEDNVAVSINGGFGSFEGFGGFGGFTVNNEESIRNQVNIELNQRAEGPVAKNEANLTFNFN